MARRTARVQAALNKELHRIGAGGRVRDLILTQSGKYRGSTDFTMSAEKLYRYRDEVIRVSRTADSCAIGLEARTAWWWVKAHAIPVARYLGRGSGGTDSPRTDLEIENEGFKIPSAIRWLGLGLWCTWVYTALLQYETIGNTMAPTQSTLCATT